MNDFFDAIENLEQTMHREHGPFVLFTLVLRTRGHGSWDLVAASSWLDADDAHARRWFADEVAERLSDEHLMKLSRAVLVSPRSEVAEAFRRAKEKGGRYAPAMLLNHSGAFGFEIEDVCIITAGRADADTAPVQQA